MARVAIELMAASTLCSVFVPQEIGAAVVRFAVDPVVFTCSKIVEHRFLIVLP